MEKQEKFYEVVVDGTRLYNNGDGFQWSDGEGLWYAMSEELTDLVPDGDDERLAQWQDLADDNIETLLRAAKEEGFIDDYNIDEDVEIKLTVEDLEEEE